MEILKEPIEINSATVNTLAMMKGTLVFNKKFAWFIIIHDYKIEENTKTKKRWHFFSKLESKSITYYLSEFKFHVWSPKRQCWTHLSEDGLIAILYDDDFPNMRKNYFNMIKAPLQFLGVKFIKNKVTSNDEPTK